MVQVAQNSDNRNKNENQIKFSNLSEIELNYQ